MELRTEGPESDMDTLCGLFGNSRQAYYQREKYIYSEVIKEEIVLQMVEKQRKVIPRAGGRKLLTLLEPALQGELMMGRDRFFDFLRERGVACTQTPAEYPHHLQQPLAAQISEPDRVF